MNWDRIEGDWKQGRVKEKWGNLTDDDLGRVDAPKSASQVLLMPPNFFAIDPKRMRSREILKRAWGKVEVRRLLPFRTFRLRFGS